MLTVARRRQHRMAATHVSYAEEDTERLSDISRQDPKTLTCSVSSDRQESEDDNLKFPQVSLVFEVQILSPAIDCQVRHLSTRLVNLQCYQCNVNISSQ